MKRATAPSADNVFYARTFVLVAIVVIAYFLYWILLPFFTALAWALFIAFLIDPLHRWLAGKLRGRESFSAALLVVAVFLILVGPATALGAAFASQAADLIQYMRGLATEHKQLSDFTNVPVLGSALTWTQESTGISIDQIQNWIEEGARRVLQPLASLGGKLFLTTVGTVINFLLTLFLLFFMIRDRKELMMDLRDLIPMSSTHKQRLFSHLGSVTRAIVYGTGVTALVQGAMIAIGFAIVGLPSPIVFGVLAALAALIPMTGTPVVWVPAVIVLAVQQRWGAAIFLFIWGVIVATVDNFLRPMLASGRAEVGALSVFIGVLGGVSAFGAMGVFLGPFILALVTVLIRFVLETRRSES
jgi:predicted PurR-regulated permease PerM